MTLLATTRSRAAAGKVFTAKETDARPVLDILTLAFAADPVVRWVFSEPERFVQAFPRFAYAFGGAAFSKGAAFRNEGTAGAALWLPPDTEPDEETMMAILQEHVPAARLEQVGAVFEALEAYHPQEPYWHLTLLGVDPARQGEGLGSALLMHALRLCDEAEQPAYLEATCERNAALYARHGFARMGEVRLEGCPQLIPMMRGARAKAMTS